MEEKMIIGTAEMEDLPAWMELVMEMEEYFPGLESNSYRETVISNIHRGSALCAKVENQLVGILLYCTKSNCLSQMAVHPSWRNHGIGSAMVRWMLNKLDPMRNVSVTTYRAEDRKGAAARAFYRKMGFEEGELLIEYGYPVQRFILRRDG